MNAPVTKTPREPLGKRNYGPMYSFPMAGWFTAFFLAPLIIIVVFSFLRKGLYGGVEWHFTLEAYRGLVTPSFITITLRTLVISTVATIITILIALPCGYCMARSKHQTLLLLLIIVPFWTNFLIRVFAWMIILGNNGFINVFLIRINLITDYIPLLYNQRAVTLVLVYMYLPYAILPLFATIDKFDFSLLEAARDLGAGKLTSIVKVLFPNIKAGIMTAVLFTFIPIFGQYAVPQLVGGTDSYMLGNIIADQILKSRNWPLASAISMVLAVVTTVGVLLMMNMQRRETARVTAVTGGEAKGDVQAAAGVAP
uniref:Spermidine putrescine ABC transporter permease component PotB (TC 3.A.1.11.1) n=1 Tax=uncultured bacterium contig00013 TaxID=1181504 RepID=A0A806K0S2_9BACT|nr:spermidine putrescine ABC transporter permease component PotB (TC 3.A.1.11.1) [uncultured bacterium contig00013]